MNRLRTELIVQDVREEFAKLRVELCHYADLDADVGQMRRRLAEQMPTQILALAQKLLDTLLNYLMEDAVTTLTDAPTLVKNGFYDLDLRSRVKSSFSLERETLTFSFDRRLLCGGLVAGVTATVGGIATALFLCSLIFRVIGGVATLVASALAFRALFDAATDAARDQLQQDLEEYVTRCERQVASWLRSVEQFFVAEFKAFLEDAVHDSGGKP